jgi:hypothetical protein
MKLTASEVTGLLNKSKPVTPTIAITPSAQPKRCGREIARSNELKTMKAVAQFGHLRISELACLWNKAAYGEQLARRTVTRLVKQGLLLERRNALGSKSLCLTRVGAEWLSLRGFDARHTLDLTSVSGATFFHRTLASRYLLYRQAEGFQVAGEYLILRRKLPFTVEPLLKSLRKLPDGLVWQRKANGRCEVELVEQEAAAKARGELERCLAAAEYVGSMLDANGQYELSGLIFVFDRNLQHARRILSAATSLWGDRPSAERTALERRVRLVAVELRDPLVWVSHTETTLSDYRQRSGT